MLLPYTCLFAGFLAGNAATMFLTHWLCAVIAAFGRGPVSAPHRMDILAVVMMTLLHPAPWAIFGAASAVSMVRRKAKAKPVRSDP
jgi:hypothetical protein